MRRNITAMTAVCLAIALAACGGSEPNSSETTSEVEESGAEITIAGFSYSGAETVSVGDTLTVVNEDTVGHTWTAEDGSFDSGTLAEGETFEHTFDEAGEYEYVCSIHPQMAGSITVEG